MNCPLVRLPRATGSSGYSRTMARVLGTPLSWATRLIVYRYGINRILSCRYLRLMDRYGSAKRQGCLSWYPADGPVAPQPDMVMKAGVKAFHCRSRVYVCGLPPKMPSMSPAA